MAEVERDDTDATLLRVPGFRVDVIRRRGRRYVRLADVVDWLTDVCEAMDAQDQPEKAALVKHMRLELIA